MLNGKFSIVHLKIILYNHGKNCKIISHSTSTYLPTQTFSNNVVYLSNDDIFQVGERRTLLYRLNNLNPHNYLQCLTPTNYTELWCRYIFDFTVFTYNFTAQWARRKSDHAAVPFCFHLGGIWKVVSNSHELEYGAFEREWKMKVDLRMIYVFNLCKRECRYPLRTNLFEWSFWRE